jgi:deoxyinosine 3'endonuclease (endonuclease V)
MYTLRGTRVPGLRRRYVPTYLIDRELSVQVLGSLAFEESKDRADVFVVAGAEIETGDFQGY